MSEPKKRKPARPKFLDPRKIEVALAEIAQISKDQGIDVALAGGCALQLYGSPRFTQDIDILAGARFANLRTAKPLSFGGVSTKTPNGVPLDLIIRADQYKELYAEALQDCMKLAGVPVPVVDLPHLAAMKLAAGRDKDLADLEFILCESGASLQAVIGVVRSTLGVYAAEEIKSIRDVGLWKRKEGKV